MKSYSTLEIDKYVEELASGNPVPGGGGTSAIVGALAAALSSMVANLTIGKKRYADVEDEMKQVLADSDKVIKELLALIDKDPEMFEPLSKAYGMKTSTPREEEEKARVMEKCLQDAASAPLAVMDCCAQVLELVDIVAAKGSKMVVSDAGCAAVLAKGALEAAALNVLANTQFMKDKEYARQLNTDVARFLADYQDKAEKVYDKTYGQLLRKGLS